MENKELALEIQKINEKLDVITRHLAEQEKRAREIEELKADLSLITKDMFDAAVEELQDVAHHFDTRDLVFLFKMLLRNVRPLTRLLQQVQSFDDLSQDLRPLGKQAFQQALETLDELDRKGYFAFFAEAVKIIDTVVTSFTVEDVRLLRENITTILITVKNMTQPQMLSAVNNALDFFQKLDMDVTEDISLLKIAREMNKPEIKRGIFFMLQFMKNVSIPKHPEN
ncbi:DUF1641 domain-containing protein [Calditrichota bacterium LG25]|uniref:Uncharacterized conserved protein YjgD, DUF1641 family n=1 Tax=Caldithrix abyssi DSM 13497 TaxID=880073 RepID=H1XYZ8_CALAY|nr:DUF1641 domain-containing protein [Caldithrix abyssi]APF18022.1 Uncharacterized conserved protein YjgD, DUF1641 family [Caldithrix abyssi DSM 13497]EHO42069.1 hypothetical protein Calab_2459 [Caldithrix abyssi DSM 13497]